MRSVASFVVAALFFAATPAMATDLTVTDTIRNSLHSGYVTTSDWFCGPFRQAFVDAGQAIKGAAEATGEIIQRDVLRPAKRASKPLIWEADYPKSPLLW